VVVVGNAAREGLEAVLFGNMAERLIGRIPGSVLALKSGRRVHLASPWPRKRVGGASLSSTASNA
jgi:hypothetical protein